ncbi:MAG: hypothetical protein MI754_05145, partial [Chromatiales bacterium]|nr:hypothetical protein [Chromatiales bacterium]
EKRVEDVVTIKGEVYGIGWLRTVTRRRGPNDWEHLSEGLWQEGDKGAGFTDLDGFDHNDLYAVGGDSDVWHYDGGTWTPLDVTDKHFRPKAVCCAEDGYVYIVGAWGVVIRGRGDQWESYFPEEVGPKLVSVVSYNGRIYMGSEEGVYVLDHNAKSLVPERYDFEGQIAPIYAHRLDVGHGLLMMAGFYSVALFDGKQWKYLYGGGPTPQDEAQLLEHMLRATEDSVDALGDLRDVLKKETKK